MYHQISEPGSVSDRLLLPKWVEEKLIERGFAPVTAKFLCSVDRKRLERIKAFHEDKLKLTPLAMQDVVSIWILEERKETRARLMLKIRGLNVAINLRENRE